MVFTTSLGYPYMTRRDKIFYAWRHKKQLTCYITGFKLSLFTDNNIDYFVALIPSQPDSFPAQRRGASLRAKPADLLIETFHTKQISHYHIRHQPFSLLAPDFILLSLVQLPEEPRVAQIFFMETDENRRCFSFRAPILCLHPEIY